MVIIVGGMRRCGLRWRRRPVVVIIFFSILDRWLSVCYIYYSSAFFFSWFLWGFWEMWRVLLLDHFTFRTFLFHFWVNFFLSFSENQCLFLSVCLVFFFFLFSDVEMSISDDEKYSAIIDRDDYSRRSINKSKMKPRFFFWNLEMKTERSMSLIL